MPVVSSQVVWSGLPIPVNLFSVENRKSHFSCRVCGECCRGDQKVWLNPVDLSRLAHHLELPERELEPKSIIVQEAAEHGIRRPRLRFDQTPAGLQCRFLINDLDETGRLWGRCCLHNTETKPLVCRLAPLSRSIDLNSGREDWTEVPPVVGCPGWPGNPPPAEGRPIPAPELDERLRSDLDSETAYFHHLNGD